MAGTLELHSFVNKFCNLWSIGKSARLVVECQAGQATVNLQLDLGHQPVHPQQEHRRKPVTPSRLRRSARRAQARDEAAANAVHATEAVEAAVQTSKTSSAAANSAPSTKDASDEPEQVTATSTQTKEAAVQAAEPTPLAIDAAVQADPQQQSLQLPPQAEQALQFPPPMVKDVFCPDGDFSMASWAEHEHERRDRDHQRAEDRRRDLENFQKMLDESLNFSVKF